MRCSGPEKRNIAEGGVFGQDQFLDWNISPKVQIKRQTTKTLPARRPKRWKRNSRWAPSGPGTRHCAASFSDSSVPAFGLGRAQRLGDQHRQPLRHQRIRPLAENADCEEMPLQKTQGKQPFAI
jgi:hypothetical protein